MVCIRKRCPEFLRKQHARQTAAAARKKATKTEGPCAKALRRKHATKLASTPANPSAIDDSEPQDVQAFPPSSRPPWPHLLSPIEVADSAIVLEDDDNETCGNEVRGADNGDIARSIGRNLIVPSDVQIDTLLNILCAFQDTEETEEALQCVLRLAAASAKPGDEFGVQFLRNCISQLNELSIDHTRLATIIDLLQKHLEKDCDRAVCQIRSLGKMPLNHYTMIEDVPRTEQSELAVPPTTNRAVGQNLSTIDAILDATMEDLVEATEHAEQAEQADEKDPRAVPGMIEAELDAAIADLVSVVVEEEQEDSKATPITTDAELKVPSSGLVDVAEEVELHSNATPVPIEAEPDAPMSYFRDAAEQLEHEEARATGDMTEAEPDVLKPGVVDVTEAVEHAAPTKSDAVTELTMASAVDIPEETKDVAPSVPSTKNKRSKKKNKKRSTPLSRAVQDKLNDNRSPSLKALRPWKPNDGTASFYVARAPMNMPLDLFVRSAVDAHYFASDESPATIAAYTREVRRVWTRLQPEQSAAWVKLFNSLPTTESLSVRGQNLLKTHGLLVKSLSDACVPA